MGNDRCSGWTRDVERKGSGFQLWNTWRWKERPWSLRQVGSWEKITTWDGFQHVSTIAWIMTCFTTWWFRCIVVLTEKKHFAPLMVAGFFSEKFVTCLTSPDHTSELRGWTVRSLLPPTGSRSRNAKVAQPDMPGFGEVPSERTAEMPGGEHHLPTEAWHGNNWMGLLCGRLDRKSEQSGMKCSNCYLQHISRLRWRFQLKASMRHGEIWWHDKMAQGVKVVYNLSRD